MARALLLRVARYYPPVPTTSPALSQPHPRLLPLPLLRRHAPSPLRFVPFSLSSSSVSTSSDAPSDGGGGRKGEGEEDGAGTGGFVDYLGMSDEELMEQCDMGTFKASGPGGQHRNKRESAVRLKHRPTGIIAQGMQALLDLLYAVEGSVSDAAKILGLSTGALSRLILSDDSLRTAANELRASKGLKPLR
ncbi:unnamed protein product [Urochloa humidicola]